MIDPFGFMGFDSFAEIAHTNASNDFLIDPLPLPVGFGFVDGSLQEIWDLSLPVCRVRRALS
jgi:hypothetical protein